MRVLTVACWWLSLSLLGCAHPWTQCEKHLVPINRMGEQPGPEAVGRTHEQEKDAP